MLPPTGNRTHGVHEMRRLKTSTAWILALLLLAAMAMPVSAAPKQPSFSLEACLPGSSQIRLDISWQDIRVDQYSAGVGMRNGMGLGIMSEPFKATTSGSESVLLPRKAGQQEVEVAAAAIHLRGQVVASDQLTRPRTGWPACP
jgi:hypothetical protein